MWHKRYNADLETALVRAIGFATHRGAAWLEPENLLWAILGSEDDVAVKALLALKVDHHLLRSVLEARVVKNEGERFPWVPPVSPPLKAHIMRAEDLAELFGHDCVGGEHVLLAMVQNPDEILHSVFSAFPQLKDDQLAAHLLALVPIGCRRAMSTGTPTQTAA